MSEPPQCCICLDDLTSPASLPCGHRFCLGCIGEYWRIHGSFLCPVCKTSFPNRPLLETNQTQHDSSATEVTPSSFKAGEVPCDFCPAKCRAVKCCLQCMASYCTAHLEPHYMHEDFSRHVLLSVVKNLEDSVCRLHGKHLNRFCRSDQTCICAMCEKAEHRGHHIISINREAAKKKVKLKRRGTKLQQDIQDRLGKIEKMRHSMNPSKENQKEERIQTEAHVRQLEEEVAELQKKTAELQQLSQTDDNLQFLQTFLHTGLSR